ncbi:MAG: type II secretion system protein GspK [Caulobacteraceae bacterium]
MRLAKPGSALVVATLIAMLLAAAAATMLFASRASRSVATEGRRMEQARLGAEALAAKALVFLSEGKHLPLDNQPAPLPDMPEGAQVRLQDVAGLVDLNAAPPDQIAVLLKALGSEEATAATIADRIADWRDEDDLRRTLGAEGSDYAGAGRPPPGNKPFITEGELSGVLGLDESAAECLAPYVTVYSGQETLNRDLSPQGFPGLDDLKTMHGDVAAFGAPVGHVIIITVQTPLSSRSRLQLRQWVRLTGNARRPFIIHRAAIDFVRAGAQAPASCPIALRMGAA